jgi:hypothetical protein
MDLKTIPKTYDTARAHQSKFWINQSMPKLDELVYVDKDIDCKTKFDIKLPKEYMFSDITETSDLKTISKFIYKHNTQTLNGYVKYYSESLLNYLLTIPSSKNLSFGVIKKDTNQYIGIVIAHTMNNQINHLVLDTVESILILVHNKYRNKRLSVLMMKELFNRGLDLGINHGLFGTDYYISKPITEVNNYHRALNIKKLIDNNFLTFDESVDLTFLKNRLHISEQLSENFRRMEEKDIKQVYNLLCSYFMTIKM